MKPNPIPLLLIVVLFGCDRSERDTTGEWAGTMDTLANGAVVVHNPEEGLWGEREAWVVREDLRIGSAMSEGPDLFGRAVDLAADGEGRIHVLDRQAKELRTFGPDGSHLRTVGREGSGPGEFRDPIGLALGPGGDRIYVVDPRNSRYTVYSTDGEYVAQHQRNVGGYSLPWNGGFGSDGRFHEKIFTRGGHAVLRMDSAFTPVDTAWVPEFDSPTFDLTTESGSMSAGVPFSATQVQRWDPRGYLWLARTGDYTITQVGMDGDTVRVIHGPPTPEIPVSAEEREEAIEGLDWFRRQGGRIEPGAIPSVKPPISTFHVVADGHIWVRLTAPAGEAGADYHVLDPEGRFLGRVQTADGFGSAPIFRGDTAYAVVSDSLGVEYVVRNIIGGSDDRG